MQDVKIDIAEIEYVADMLKAIVWIKDELPSVPSTHCMISNKA